MIARVEKRAEVAIETVGVKNKKFARRLRPWGGVIEHWPALSQLCVNFGRWKPLPNDDRKKGVLTVLAQPGDLLIVCEVGRQLPVSEQHVRYFLVLRDKVTQVVALEELATVAEARRRFLLSRMNAASGERMMHALRAA